MALENAAAAMEVVISIMRKPPRNAMMQLTAARLVLDVAGIGAESVDQQRQELLIAMRGKLSAEAYAEVVRTLAELSAVPSPGKRAGLESNGGSN